MAEFHPFEYVFDDDKDVKELKVRYPYFQEGPLEFEADGSYADLVAKIEPQKEYEWTHGVGEVITALIDTGLHLDFFHEFPYACFADLPFMEKGADDNWRLPQGMPAIPLTYSIKATGLV